MWAKENKNKEKMKERYGGHCERKKKISLELWNFIFVALGDTNDGKNIPSASALKFHLVLNMECMEG